MSELPELEEELDELPELDESPVEPPEEPPPVVTIRRYSLLHQPSLPEAVRTLAQPGSELSVTVSSVPFARMRIIS